MHRFCLLYTSVPGFQYAFSHQPMNCGTRMNAIGYQRSRERGSFDFGFFQSVHHGRIQIGEAGFLFGGKFAEEIAEANEHRIVSAGKHFCAGDVIVDVYKRQKLTPFSNFSAE